MRPGSIGMARANGFGSSCRCKTRPDCRQKDLSRQLLCLPRSRWRWRARPEPASGRPYAKQTWAQGLDAKGRPIQLPDSQPTEKGALIWPNLNGATVWMSPSYSPQTGTVYVPVREIGATYFKRNVRYKAGTMFGGGGENELPPDDTWGAIRALQAETGEMKWEFKLFLCLAKIPICCLIKHIIGCPICSPPVSN